MNFVDCFPAIITCHRCFCCVLNGFSNNNFSFHIFENNFFTKSNAITKLFNLLTMVEKIFPEKCSPKKYLLLWVKLKAYDWTTKRRQIWKNYYQRIFLNNYFHFKISGAGKYSILIKISKRITKWQIIDKSFLIKISFAFFQTFEVKCLEVNLFTKIITLYIYTIPSFSIFCL